MQYLGENLYYIEFLKLRRVRRKREKLDLFNKMIT